MTNTGFTVLNEQAENDTIKMSVHSEEVLPKLTDKQEHRRSSVADVLDEPSMNGCPCCLWCEPEVDLQADPENTKFCDARSICVVMMYFALVATSITLVALGYLEQFAVYVQQIGIYGNIAFVAALVYAQQPFGWGYSFILVAIGFTYGWTGALTILVGQQIGSITAFFLASYIAKGFIRRIIDNAPYSGIPVVFHGFEKKLKETKRVGIVYLSLMRLTPLPTGITTSLISFSEVGFPMFWLSSLIGQWIDIPIYLNTGVLIKTIGSSSNTTDPDFDVETDDDLEGVAFIAQVVVTLLLLGGSAWYGRRLIKSLEAEMREDELNEDEEADLPKQRAESI